MAVINAASKPPVQDSAVARKNAARRQAAIKAAARLRDGSENIFCYRYGRADEQANG